METESLKRNVNLEAYLVKKDLASIPSKSWIPLARVVLKNRKQFAVVLDFKDEEDKYRVFNKLGIYARDNDWDIEAMYFSCEAWMKSFSKDGEEFKSGKKVREYDDKKEVIVITGTDLEKQYMSYIDIRRNHDDTMILGDISEPLETTGELIDTFLRAYRA